MEAVNEYKSNKMDPLNFLRSISVICVFILHVSIFTNKLGFQYDLHTWFLKTPAWSAVWILIILSGYLIGKGFLTGRYPNTGKGFMRFYWKRFKKVGIPTWIFVFIACTIAEPEFIANNPNVIFKILTFTYYNVPACNSIGATWYVSTLMQLYMLAPFICLLINHFKKSLQENKVIVIITILAFLLIGFCIRYYCFYLGYDWSSKVYVPFYANLDLFISGILINLLITDSQKPLHKAKSKHILNLLELSFIILVIINCYIAFKADYSQTYLFIYQYLLPSVYLIFICIYIYIVEVNKPKQVPLIISNILKNPMRLIDCFSKISFEFYLVHSMVISKIYMFLINESLLAYHILVTIVSFIISLFISLLLHNMIKNIYMRG